jgi:hypothetical protein
VRLEMHFEAVIELVCVRGSPLTLKMGLVDSRTAHTTPRLAMYSAQ